MTDRFSQYPILYKPSVNGNARLLPQIDRFVLILELFVKGTTILKESVIYFNVVKGGGLDE